ncbi:MAG: hypothetical protein KF754_00120 [Planctomycetes bacterium]|nr:hypothetical protein [Planctomycetota bacterium]
MPRITAIRFVFALGGATVLACGVLLDLHWLSLAGLVTSACAEALGLTLAKLPASTPGLRLMQATGQALPSLGVAAIMPLAMLVAAAVVINAILSGGVESVLMTRGNGHTMGGHTARTLALGASNASALAGAGLASGAFVIPGTTGAGLIVVGVGWAVVAATTCAIDATVALRRR